MSRCTDAQAPVGQGHRAADEHRERAEPDQADERVEIEADAVGALLQLIAEHGIKIAAPTWVNAGLSGAASLHGVLAFGGSELGHLLAVACDFEQRDSFAVVRPLTRNNAFEGERVPRNLRGIAG